MPNKPLLVINTSPLMALVAALDDFCGIGEVVVLVVPVVARMKAEGIQIDDALVQEALAAALKREMNNNQRPPLVGG